MASNLNPANAVTASRFLTLPPFLYCIDHGYQQWATILMMICGVLDLFDGMVARWFKCQTPFGAVFDALADALCYGFCMVVVAAYGWVPWGAVVIILVLGVVNAAMRAIYARRAGRTVNYQSHAMERLVAYAAYLGGFGTGRYETAYFYWIFAVLMTVVMIYDTKRMVFDPIPPEATA